MSMEIGANLIGEVHPETSTAGELRRDVRVGEFQELNRVSGEFESIFIRMFLKEALKPLFKGYLSESGSADSIYRYYLTDTLARSIGRSEPIGFSSLLQLQIKGETSPDKE